MLLRILSLFMLAGCSLAPSVKSLSADDASASYTRYIAGNGNGLGIKFHFEFPDSVPGVEVQELIINEEEVEAEVATINPLTIVADRFYKQPKPTMDNAAPEPPETPLYTAKKYKAMLTIEARGRTKTFLIDDFEKKEPEMYP